MNESALKDLPMTCIRKIIVTMQNMAMTQDKVNENFIKAKMIKSSPKKLHQKPMERLKIINNFMFKLFFRKEKKFKKIR
jgi:hypothetical protein